jgi:hypothetical protein
MVKGDPANSHAAMQSVMAAQMMSIGQQSGIVKSTMHIVNIRLVAASCVPIPGSSSTDNVTSPRVGRKAKAVI